MSSLEGNNHSHRIGRGKPGGSPPGQPDRPVFRQVCLRSGSFGSIILGATGERAGQDADRDERFLGDRRRLRTSSFNSPVVGSVGNAGGAVPPNAAFASGTGGGDAEKVTYISPKFGGFQVGMTYSYRAVREPGRQRAATNTTGQHCHDGLLEGAVSYSGKFGDVGIRLRRRRDGISRRNCRRCCQRDRPERQVACRRPPRLRRWLPRCRLPTSGRPRANEMNQAASPISACAT